MVKFQVCDLFKNTYIEKVKANPNLARRFEEFKAQKMQNPLQPFGSSDSTLSSEGQFRNITPRLRHAHLTSDISVFYSMGGAKPTIFKLYGFFSHDDSGTGQPANIKKQRSLAKQMSNQTFS